MEVICCEQMLGVKFPFQWWIQDFPDGGRGTNLLFVTIFIENCMQWKNLDRQVARLPTAPWIRHYCQ